MHQFAQIHASICPKSWGNFLQPFFIPHSSFIIPHSYFHVGATLAVARHNNVTQPNVGAGRVPARNKNDVRFRNRTMKAHAVGDMY